MNKKLYKSFRCVLAPFLKFAYKLETTGLENVPESGGIIICANHTSNLDPILLAVAVKRNIRFMAKSELFKSKILKKLLITLGAFPVIRGKAGKSAIESSFKALANQEILGIFVEGTRSKTGKLLRPKSGASLISLKSNTPILPACINCTKSPGTVKIFNSTKIFFGSLIYPKNIVENFSDEGGIDRSALKLMNQAIMSQIVNLREKIVVEEE